MRLPYPGRSLVLPPVITDKRAPSVLDPDIFAILNDSRLGYELKWARAARCTCRVNDQTEQPDPTCSVCSGTGWRYVHPHPELYPRNCAADGSLGYEDGEPIRGLLSGMRTGREKEQHGEFVPGQATLTVKADVKLGLWDRFVMGDALSPFDQVVSRPAGSSWPAWTVPIGRNSVEQLRYPAFDVLDVRTVDRRFRMRTDYTLSAGNLTFLAGRGPAPGERWTVRYRHHPHWIVIDIPRTVSGIRQPPRQTGLPFDRYGELPQRASVLLDFLVRW